jgi:hypothetical protein
MTGHVLHGRTSILVAGHGTKHSVFDFFEQQRARYPSKLASRSDSQLTACLENHNLRYATDVWGRVISCSALIQCEVMPGWAEIGMTSVTKNAQRNGIGKLHVATNMIAAYMQSKRAFCGVEDGNERVFRMLDQLGWVTCAALPDAIQEVCRAPEPGHTFTTLVAPQGSEVAAAAVMIAAIDNPAFELKDKLFFGEYREALFDLRKRAKSA